MQMRIVRPLALSALLLAAGVAPALAQQGGGGGGRPPAGPPLQLSSSAFTDVSPYPEKYSCVPGMAGGPPDASKMVSPPLSWVNPPAGTKSFVLILHDPDAHAAKGVRRYHSLDGLQYPRRCDFAAGRHEGRFDRGSAGGTTSPVQRRFSGHARPQDRFTTIRLSFSRSTPRSIFRRARAATTFRRRWTVTFSQARC